jgi:hypothetical protein
LASLSTVSESLSSFPKKEVFFPKAFFFICRETKYLSKILKLFHKLETGRSNVANEKRRRSSKPSERKTNFFRKKSWGEQSFLISFVFYIVSGDSAALTVKEIQLHAITPMYECLDALYCDMYIHMLNRNFRQLLSAMMRMCPQFRLHT